MFAGIPFSKFASVFGDHQRIDRLAYSYLRRSLDIASFPSLKMILANEGRYGPDAAQYVGESEEHFYNPTTEGAEILSLLIEYYDNLVKALKNKDMDKAAGAASWLAHAVVDGLTPAHHFPYHEAVSKLLADTGHVRDNVTKHFYINAGSPGESIKRTWQLVGSGGLLHSHFAFELHMAVALQLFRPRIKSALPPKESVEEIFLRQAKMINKLNLYDKFMRFGANPTVSVKLRRVVGPAMVETVSMLWAKALKEADT